MEVCHMDLSFFLIMVFLIVLTYVETRNMLHIYESLFVYMIMVFLYTSFVSVFVDDLKVWKIPEKAVPYISFRLAEIFLFPMLSLWFLEMWHIFKGIIPRLLVIVVFLFIPVLIVNYMNILHLITIKKWSIYQTILSWAFFYPVSYFAQKVFHSLLHKEGVY